MNIPVASLMLTNILKNLKLPDFKIEHFKLDALHSYCDITGLEYSLLVKKIIKKYAESDLDFEVIHEDRMISFEQNLIKLNVRENSDNTIMLELILSHGKKIKTNPIESLQRTLQSLSEKHSETWVDLTDISIYKTTLQSIQYAMHFEDYKKVISKLVYTNLIQSEKDYTDHKGREYKVINLDMGLYTISVNTNPELDHIIEVIL